MFGKFNFKAFIAETKAAKKKPSLSREDLVEDFFDILRESDHDPSRLITEMLALMDEKAKTYKLEDFITSSAKSQDREKVIRYRERSYKIKNSRVPSYHIYHNIYPSSFDREDGEVLLFTWLLDQDGLHMARYENLFEFGSGHVYLPDTTKEDSGVLAAGELEIVDNHILFNFQSGSYMKEMNLSSTPRYLQFLIFAVRDILSYGADSCEYTDKVIFPVIYPQRWELQRDLARAGNKIVIDEKEDLSELIQLETIQEAQDYFSTYPYERVTIVEDGIMYTNPYREQPTLFIPVVIKRRYGNSQF